MTKKHHHHHKPKSVPATGGAYGYGGWAVPALANWGTGCCGDMTVSSPALSQDQFGTGYPDVAVGSDGSTGAT